MKSFSLFVTLAAVCAIGLSLPASAQQPAEVVITGPGKVQDTFTWHIVESWKLSNYGGSADLISSGRATTFIRFDLSSLPPGTQILSAEMWLYHHATLDSEPPAAAGVCRLINMDPDWVEGSMDGWAPDYPAEQGATHYSPIGDNTGGHPWSYAEEFLQVNVMDHFGWWSWNVTSAAIDWFADPSTNYGLNIRYHYSTGGNSSHAMYRSTNYYNPAYRPKLVLSAIVPLSPGTLLLIY